MDSASTVTRLRRLLDDYQTARRAGVNRRADEAAVSLPSGWAALDVALSGGVHPGSLVECLCDSPGAGALQIALHWGAAAARAASSAAFGSGGRAAACVVFVDGDGDFYPPAAAALGVSLQQLVVVRPQRPADAFWAAEQCLRCPALGAVVATLGRLDETQSRRLQLAAEAGGGVGIVVRPRRGSGKSFATVRAVVEPVSVALASLWDRLPAGQSVAPAFQPVSVGRGMRKVFITLTRIREGMPADPFEVELPDEALAGVVSAASAAGTPAGGGGVLAVGAVG